MPKIFPSKPFLLMLYGYPGAGKTYFSRQFTETVQAAHMQSDRIRGELFETPQYDKQENDVVAQIMDYMTEEFLSAGLSVVYDTNAARVPQRHVLRNLAYKYHAQPVLVWFQMDPETAFIRNSKRDRRKSDDKYAAQWDRPTYEGMVKRMQNPTLAENYVVISGKHVFNMQQSAMISNLRSSGILASDANSRVIKPELVNLVPHPGRVDLTRRNISIR